MASTKPVLLSKSKLVAFKQCPKRLWLELYHPNLREDSAKAQRAFSIGHTIGDLARKEYPEGVLIGPADSNTPIDWQQVFRETNEALSWSPRRPIFEATCRHDGVLVRADLLIPATKGWHMAEVKSSTGVKDYHRFDLAIQTWVMRGAGVDVQTVELRHVDNQFVYPGGSEYKGLFAAADVQEEIEGLLPDVPLWIADARKVAASGEPTVAMGPHCTHEIECGFLKYCTRKAGLAIDYPVTLLPGTAGKPLGRRLADEGYTDLRQVPSERIPKGWLRTIYEVMQTGVEN